MTTAPTLPPRLKRTLLDIRPHDAEALRRWVAAMLEIHVPHRAICAGHDAPLDYLAHAFFEQPGDAVVWANRGGGKTFYGAVATLLDLWFKPGVSVRILAGSRDQASHMYDYLMGFLDRPLFRAALARRTRNALRLANGSEVELLAHTETAVRGTRVQKVRCDEIELFDRRVWQAVQMTTRGQQCGPTFVPGRVEVFSTMHRPFGLMHDLIDAADDPVRSDAPGTPNALGSDERHETHRPWRAFRWCVLDVIERCPPARSCDPCPLWSCCAGRAKRARGFLPIDDVIDQQARTSRASFETEMLCQRPTRSDTVFPQFDPALHVRPVEPDPALRWIAGMDFGMRSPVVMLWAQVRPMPPSDHRGAAAEMIVKVIDEYIASDRSLPVHLRAIAARRWPEPAWVAVDPAGRARNEQTGVSNVAMLRKAGWSVRANRSGLLDGLEVIRQRLQPAEPGVEPTLVIHPRCEQLIESLTQYHYDPDRPHDATPVKDGPDHAVDALRYMLVELARPCGVRCERY